MLILAICLFVIAALFGLFVLFHVLLDKPTPKPAVLIHGCVAALGVILVFYANYQQPSMFLITSLIIFVIAALGGLTLLTFDLRNKPIPKIIAIIHPLVAVIALLSLVVYVLK